MSAGVLPIHSTAPWFTALSRGVSGTTPKCPQVNVVSSEEAMPNAQSVSPSFSISGWKSMTHSCSLEMGMSRPSAMAPLTLCTTGSLESAENIEWMWKSAHITPVESTLWASVAAMSLDSPAATVTVVSNSSHS